LGVVTVIRGSFMTRRELVLGDRRETRRSVQVLRTTVFSGSMPLVYIDT
jgi:hypothetical protein